LNVLSSSERGGGRGKRKVAAFLWGKGGVKIIPRENCRSSQTGDAEKRLL